MGQKNPIRESSHSPAPCPRCISRQRFIKLAVAAGLLAACSPPQRDADTLTLGGGIEIEWMHGAKMTPL
jgi:hypothetical protein